MHVIVIGGGAVGLCVAEVLSARDCSVTVLERDRCGAAASAGNAGWITPSLATPVPAPGVIGQSLRWLVDPSGPLWIRPTFSPVMLSWIARFLVSCQAPTYRRGLVALQRAAALAVPAFDAMAARGVEFERHDDPLLFPAFERGELEYLWRMAADLRAAGSRQQVDRLSPQDLRDLEPALGQNVLGGLAARGEHRVRPEVFTAGLARALVARGVEVLEGVRVMRLEREAVGWRVDGLGGSWRGDGVVIASGVESVRLLAPLGLRLPLAAAKGYSRTYLRDPSAPRQAVYLEKPKVAISVFDGGVRVSGTLELGARELSLSERRLTALTASARRALPGWRMPTESHDWAGMRSLSPDGLPFIGPLPGHDGLHLASGHGTLGITLSPLTGELLAGLLVDGVPRLDAARREVLEAFDPARTLRAGVLREWSGPRVNEAERIQATIGGVQ